MWVGREAGSVAYRPTAVIDREDCLALYVRDPSIRAGDWHTGERQIVCGRLMLALPLNCRM